MNELQYTLYSLIKQTVSPKNIIINLADSDFNNIPIILHNFEKFGVIFNKTDDLKSYKKLVPTLQMYPDKCIVTADDDLFYPVDWLEKLYNAHMKNPDCIVCHLTTRIKHTNEKIFSYKEWKYNKSFTEPSFSNCILSGAGALFRKELLHKDVLNRDLFMSLSPFADDIWDYFMAVIAGTKIMQIANSYKSVKYINPYREYNLNGEETLTQINVGQDKNDTQFKSILKHYDYTEKDFIQVLKSN